MGKRRRGEASSRHRGGDPSIGGIKRAKPPAPAWVRDVVSAEAAAADAAAKAEAAGASRGESTSRKVRHGAGACVGLESLLGGAPRTATLVAKSRGVVVAFVPRAAIAKALRDDDANRRAAARRFAASSSSDPSKKSSDTSEKSNDPRTNPTAGTPSARDLLFTLEATRQLEAEHGADAFGDAAGALGADERARAIASRARRLAAGAAALGLGPIPEDSDADKDSPPTHAHAPPRLLGTGPGGISTLDAAGSALAERLRRAKAPFLRDCVTEAELRHVVAAGARRATRRRPRNGGDAVGNAAFLETTNVPGDAATNDNDPFFPRTAKTGTPLRTTLRTNPDATRDLDPAASPLLTAEADPEDPSIAWAVLDGAFAARRAPPALTVAERPRQRVAATVIAAPGGVLNLDALLTGAKSEASSTASLTRSAGADATACGVSKAHLRAAVRARPVVLDAMCLRAARRTLGVADDEAERDALMVDRGDRGEALERRSMRASSSPSPSPSPSLDARVAVARLAFRLAESAETHFCGGAALWRRGGEIALARARKKALQRRLEGGGIQALVAAARGAGAGAAVGGAGKKNLDARARKKKPRPPGGVRDRELPALVSAAPSPLRALTLAELHLLLASPGARRVRAGRAGDAFVRQGDVGGAMFVVLRGELEALVKTRGRVDGGRDAPEARKPRVVATYRAGDAFGHRSLVYGARREATVMVASGGGGEKGGGKSGGGKKKKGGETSFTPNDDDAAWVLEISRKAVEPVVRRRPTLADHFARYCLEREARERALEGFGGVEEESALDPGAEEEEGAADGFVASFGAFSAPRRPHPNAPDAPPRGDASDDRSDQPPGLSARLPASSARLASLARDAHAWLTSGARPPESRESRDARRVVVSTLAFGSASRDAAAALERVGVFAGLDTRQVLTALREGATVEAHPPGSDVGRQPWDHLGRGRGIHDDDQIDEAREREMSGALERCVVVLEGACEVFEEASPGVEAPLGTAGGSDANDGGKKVGERRSARRWARRWARVGGSRVAGRAFTSGVCSRAAREIGARGRRTRARRCWSSIGARSRRCSAAPRRRSSPPPPRGSRRKTRRERRALATRAERAPPGPRGRSRRARRASPRRFESRRGFRSTTTTRRSRRRSGGRPADAPRGSRRTSRRARRGGSSPSPPRRAWAKPRRLPRG